MQAGIDVTLNNNFSATQAGVPGRMVTAQVPYIKPILDGDTNAYAAYHIMHPASVYAAPAVIPTAAVGANPWDTVFGPIGVGAQHGNIPAPANVVPSQAGTTSFA